MPFNYYIAILYIMISLTGLQKKLKKAKDKNLIVSVKTKPVISSFECEDIDGTYECEPIDMKATITGKATKAPKTPKGKAPKTPKGKSGFKKAGKSTGKSGSSQSQSQAPTPEEQADIIFGRNQQLALGRALQQSQDRYSDLLDKYYGDIPPRQLRQEQEEDDQEQERLLNKAKEETQRQRELQQQQRQQRVLSYNRGHELQDTPRDNITLIPLPTSTEGRAFDLTDDDLTMPELELGEPAEQPTSPRVKEMVAKIERKQDKRTATQEADEAIDQIRKAMGLKKKLVRVNPEDDKFRNIKHKDYNVPVLQPTEPDLGDDDVIQQPRQPTLNERMAEETPIITEETTKRPIEEQAPEDDEEEDISEEEPEDELEGSVGSLKSLTRFLPELPPKNGRYYSIAEIRSQPLKVRNKIFKLAGISAKQPVKVKEQQYKEKYIY